MTIWVGQDGTLNDDEGDGPAAAWDPIEAWEDEAVHWGSIEAIESAPYPPAAGFYVGQDWGAMASSLGSAFGGSGGGGGGTDWSSSLGSLGSGLGQALGGGTGKDVGGAVGDIFGSTIQGASTGGWQGALANLATSVVSKAVVPAIQSATKAPPPQQQAAAPAATTPRPTTPQPTATTRPSATPSQRQAPSGARRQSTANPQQRLLILLDHLAKSYGMPPAQTPKPRGQRGAAAAPSQAGGQQGSSTQQLGDFMAQMMKPQGGQASS